MQNDERRVQNKLKPCPFCGSDYIRIGESEKLELLSIQFKEPIAFVECMNCCAVAGLYKVNHGKYNNTTAREEAIKAWNRRADNAGKID